MKSVYEADDSFQAQLVCDYLEHRGIAAVVHGRMLAGGVGQLPMDVHPRVWIHDDDLYERARDLVVNRFEKPQPLGERWTCPDCGEINESTFEICWACSRVAPEDESAD